MSTISGTETWGTSKFAQRLFITKLEQCEAKILRVTDYERQFIADMRAKFESREFANNPWEPSVKQINYLSSIADTL